jgi:hypothetical protein
MARSPDRLTACPRGPTCLLTAGRSARPGQRARDNGAVRSVSVTTWAGLIDLASLAAVTVTS